MIARHLGHCVVATAFVLHLIGWFALLILIPRLTNHCEMTYSWPAYHFIRVGPGSMNPWLQHPYRLYRYCNGECNNGAPSGFPVLFIPGNLGSYKQVRSLGSHAAGLKPRSRETGAGADAQLDYFTADFQEELSAFSGMLIEQQSYFVNDAIGTILSLYKADRSGAIPTTVILVGHSMGGMVAQTCLSLPNHKNGSVNTIITLGSPHERPPISFDRRMLQLYAANKRSWSMRAFVNGSLEQSVRLENKPDILRRDLVLISISGDQQDTTLHWSLSSVEGLVPDDQGFSVSTSQIPGMGFGVDHVCLLWCRQLLERVTQAITAAINPGNSYNLTGPQNRVATFKAYLYPQRDSFVDANTSGLFGGTLLGTFILRLASFVQLQTQEVVPAAIAISIQILGRQIHQWLIEYHSNLRGGTGEMRFQPMINYLHPFKHVGIVPLFSFASRNLLPSILFLMCYFIYGSNITESKLLGSILQYMVLYLLALATLWVAVNILKLSQLLCNRCAGMPGFRRWARCASSIPWDAIYWVFPLLILLSDSYRKWEWSGLYVYTFVLLQFQHYLFVPVQAICLLLAPSGNSSHGAYRQSIAMLYILMSFFFIGDFIFCCQILTGTRRELPFEAKIHLLWTSLLYLPLNLHLRCARMAMFPSPPMTQLALRFPDSTNHQHPTHSHQDCPFCIHEDGGPLAIYHHKNHPMDGVIKIGRDVFLGPTFVVISCSCSLDRQEEICSYCDCGCPACGGGRVFAARRTRFYNEAERLRTHQDHDFILPFLCNAGGPILSVFGYQNAYRTLLPIACIAAIFVYSHFKDTKKRIFFSDIMDFDEPVLRKLSPKISAPYAQKVRQAKAAQYKCS